MENIKEVDLLLKDLNIVTYQREADTNWSFIDLSDTMERVTGYPAADFINGGKRSFAEMVHLDGISDIKKKMLVSFDNQTPFEVEYRLENANGKMVWILEKGIGIYDQNGILLRIDGVLIKIAKNREIDEKFQILQQTVEQAPESIIITEPDGSICYVNKTFCDTTGYTKEEIIGENPRILKLNLETNINYKSLWNDIVSGREWRGIFQNKKKNGQEYWERSTIAPLYDEEGQLLKFIGIKKDISEEHANSVELDRLYRIDMLTKVYNRRSFFELAEEAFFENRQDEEDSAVMMLDIDYFKKINDAYGHTLGDMALTEFGMVCSKSIRKTDLIGRIGGEEFAIYLMATQLDNALILAKRLRHNVENIELFCENGEKVQFTVSIGVSQIMPTDNNLDDALRRADSALYEAKRKGRNRVEAAL
ncbi:sensor domain-containing diguanylate cyclase [Acetobacterium woodii]|uniref:Diguanylate cyclase n=1 Tax=Acetobacterium woodii (strain ATCC 29683 / DSM 1030 / JCM 2381 / KCTC 1655 / WB1) TaxID=931626 RepID=H6LIJ6_ACEWD|nr:sensor domain-containing diguanylate cyclase [Acetobacterium woodii]AFA48570.1 hypothetical protein Awo_c17900 [Acetobacterium woodii DSM 1030]